MKTDDPQLAGYDDPTPGGAGHAANPAEQVPSASVPEMKSLLALAVAAISIAALYFAQDVLVPITLAVMLSFILSPLVNFLRRWLWRGPSVLLSVLASLGVIALLTTLIGSQVAALSTDAPKYAQTIEQKLSGAQDFATARFAAISKGLVGQKPALPKLDSTRAATPAASAASRPPGPAAPAAASGLSRKPVQVEVVNSKISPFAIVKTILQPVLGPLETTVLVLIVTIFVLMQKEDLRDRFIRLFGSNDLHRTTLAMDDAGQRLSRYFLSQAAVNSAFGVVIGFGLWAIGIPSPAMWGILAGMLRFVPYIGSFLAAVAPIALGAAIDPGWSMAIYVAVLFVVVEPLTGYVVEPMLYGHSTGLSPVSVIVSAVFWTWLWGPIGLILSTPLTLCFVVMGRHVKSLEFFDVLLGDRPALSPVESFYQRMLANNPDEALDQAETLLADRALVDYYDGVVLPGLKLAAEDEARGTIDRKRSLELNRAMLTVIDDLKDHAAPDDREASDAVALARSNLVACVAGSGPFDEAVAAMVAQLLASHGVATRIIPHTAVSREAIGRLDLTGVDLVVLSHLELNGSPAAVRYLIKRLRLREPGLPIVAGLWPEGQTALTDEVVQRTVGADHFACTLAALIEALRQLLTDHRAARLSA